MAFLGLSRTLSFAQFTPLIAAQTHSWVIRTPGFQIKQPMIEDIRNDTVVWSFLNLLSNYISLPGLFLTPRTRNDLSSRPLSVDRCLSPGLLLCVQLPLVPGLLSVRSTEPYMLGTPNSIAIALASHLNSYRSYFNHDHLSPTIVFQPIVFQTRSHFNPIVFQPRSHFNHTPCN